jgi:N-acetylated-alpha-linked acidic dipeptidase
MKTGVAVAIGLCLTAPLGIPQEPAPLDGFTAETSRAEREWEAKFRAIPDPALMRAYMERLTARPHHVGSAYDRDNAEWLLGKLRGWGLDAHIETFDVLFPTPKERLLEMVGPRHLVAKIEEPAVAGDLTSAQHDEQLPTYNAYSIDGDVTGPLVYANYGLPEDYETLERQGVSVKGAIVIARYGGAWRGVKPKVAAEHGAIGCLIYSDPRDDGYAPGLPFPAGPYRPKDGVQRGSVLDMTVYPGDPLTPGVGATPDAKRLPIEQAATLTKIPVMPISYADAQPLLEALEGRTVPAAWRGALPITYRFGPGPARVHLRLKFNWDRRPLYDVIARIPGAVYPDQWILRGNHHDAWVNGAEDPVSGTISVMEEARAMAALVQQGWKPKRTILFCIWDGEEPGLLGSTEWVEAHAGELARKAAVYINSDTNGRGTLGMEGSHSLEHFINGVARDIGDPEANVTVWKRAQAERIAGDGRTPAAERAEARTRPDLRIGALGSGSDYTAFLDHVGVASLNLGFGGEDGGGIYHSIYDDFYWFTHFSDTNFVYGRALAQTAGTAAMRLAGADLLPFEFRGLADTVHRYVDEVKKLAGEKREQIVERNRQIDDGVFAAIEDPRLKTVPPVKEPVPPFLNFAPLENGLAALERAAQALDQAASPAHAQLKDANDRLVQVERAFLLDAGLPRRPWFRHQLYAPGLYTGYGAKTLPAVREAIEQKQWKLADEQIARVGKVLEDAASAMDAAANALKQASD